MKIKNDIKKRITPEIDIELGQVWLDLTSDSLYIVAYANEAYCLVNLEDGGEYASPIASVRDIEKIFGDDRDDFILVEAELHVIKEKQYKQA